MPRFRSPTLSEATCELTTASVSGLIEAVLRPCHFFVAEGIQLRWAEWTSEEIPWEVFNGRLLDSRHTRERRRFESRDVFRTNDGCASADPLLSVKYDRAAECIHVTRSIECFVSEGYDSGENVFLTRETRKWVRELVATITLAQFKSIEELRDELSCQLFQAFVGTSRLPLTSMEAPLPAFSLGELGYCHRIDVKSQPMRGYADLLEHAWGPHVAWREKIKLFELILRSTPADELNRAAAVFIERLDALDETSQLPRLLRGLIDDVSLTPYTDFVTKLFPFVDDLVEQGGLSVEACIDFLSYVLRQIGRHLTAYDLITFHHRGANYPDALFLDVALKKYIKLIECQPAHFLPTATNNDTDADRKRIRRRALRQAWYFRRHYEGHLVPDAPTSPGENARVLPPPHQRVPDDQIMDTTKRTRRLFEGDPLDDYWSEACTNVVRQSVLDLSHPIELRELGTAIFLDRPLGFGKRPGEPDQTPLLSYEAFSRSIARRRLQELSFLTKFLSPHDVQIRQAELDDMEICGVSAVPSQPGQNPAIVSVSDAWRVATDFILLQNTSRSAKEFMSLFDWSPLKDYGALPCGNTFLILADAMENTITLYTHELGRKLELRLDHRAGYQSRGGVEFPAPGLHVTRISEEEPGGWREHVVDIAVGLLEHL